MKDSHPPQGTHGEEGPPDDLVQPTPIDLLRLIQIERAVENDFWLAARSQPDVKPCMQLVDAALQLLSDLFFTADTSDDERHRRVHMVLRMYNSIGAALLLARTGYFLQSFIAQRDLMEHAFLLDYFADRPGEFAVWCTCSPSERKKRFSPYNIRKALNERDGFAPRKRTWRDKLYRLFSQYAVHLDPQHWRFAATQEHLLIGPFLDPKILRNCLFDLARLAAMATFSASAFLSGPSKSLTAKAAFHDIAKEWLATYMPGWRFRDE